MQEATELAEEIATQIEDAIDNTMQEMAEDLAAFTEMANTELNEALEEFIQKEHEAVEQIDETDIDWDNMDWEAEQQVLKKQKKSKKAAAAAIQKRAKQLALAKEAVQVEQSSNNYVVYGTGALAIACTAAVAIYCIKKQNKTDFDEDFHRV